MSGKKVLLLDDDPGMRDLLKEYITELGMTPIVSSTGKECLRLAKDNKPDTIILDLMLPDMQGDEVASELRDDPELSKIPVIFLTSLASPVDSSEPGANKEGNTVLSKKLPPEELMARLEELLS